MWQEPPFKGLAATYLIVIHQKIHIHTYLSSENDWKMNRIMRRLGSIPNVNRPDVQNYLKVIESGILNVNYPDVHISLGRLRLAI